MPCQYPTLPCYNHQYCWWPAIDDCAISMIYHDHHWRQWPSSMQRRLFKCDALRIENRAGRKKVLEYRYSPYLLSGIRQENIKIRDLLEVFEWGWTLRHGYIPVIVTYLQFESWSLLIGLDSFGFIVKSLLRLLFFEHLTSKAATIQQ